MKIKRILALVLTAILLLPACAALAKTMYVKTPDGKPVQATRDVGPENASGLHFYIPYGAVLGGPVVSNPPSKAGEAGSIPGGGTKLGFFPAAPAAGVGRIRYRLQPPAGDASGRVSAPGPPPPGSLLP